MAVLQLDDQVYGIGYITLNFLYLFVYFIIRQFEYFFKILNIWILILIFNT
jgi:hypothetical protein